jgi:dCTP deaminase
MIEPFEAGQVRQHQGQKIVSYGTSSYGYDVRCANEFKIFTNINSAIVDPKAFSEDSFVDLKSDVCIIPPNSFALARTVEYFRIPRNILTICLGKSTYARCFRGDTKVALVDGTSISLEDMAKRSDQGEDFWGYSIGPYGRIIVSHLQHPRYIGRDSLLEITLDNQEKICCTPDHEFIRRDGRLVQAGDLKPNDALMPLYRKKVRGYEQIYQPINGYHIATHQLADEWNLKHSVYAEMNNSHRHHIDHNKANNNPWNIQRLNAREALLESRRFPEEMSQFRGENKAVYKNHKVTKIKALAGDHDVYCLTVPEAGNFALESGVFVKNCGIIVNVTPLEPEWEGHVTLEFSNTTPLPAKIYANEGVAQMLFFESDEVCETSYKDRDGKYQGQRGVTLPQT